MCGRYALAGDWSDFTTTFDLDNLVPRWNIAPSFGPGFEAPILTSNGSRMARWWFIPPNWNAPLKKLPTAFNARNEEIEQKRHFRGYQLCLVPSSGWREFPGPAGKKRSFVFDRSGAFFAFGGVHSTWTDHETGEVTSTFAILTTEPSELVSPYHDRMPLIVPEADYRSWIARDAALDTLLPRAAHESHGKNLRVYEASTFGNSPRVEGPECVEPLKETQLGLF